jgi:hypothetical protein
MSSVQSFLKQRDPAATLFNAPTNTTAYYQLVADGGNLTGNYPPGYMVASAPPGVAGLLIRDMGKTVKAKVNADPNGTAVAGFFRAVQLIDPSKPALVPFGVLGNAPTAGNVGNKGYQTYYLATVVDGSVATDSAGTPAVLPSTYVPNGGSM